MSSSKLHLKETPAERRERDLHRARKAAKKRRRQATPGASSSNEAGPSHSKRQHTDSHDPGPYEFLDDDEYGPPPPPASSSRQSDFRRVQAALDEMWFRDKMAEAMEDDERLDVLEARLNGYAHIPRRWRGGGMDRMDDEVGMDPNVMEEETYVEWVREGMWRCVLVCADTGCMWTHSCVRRRHAAEYEEQERKKAMRAAQKAYERVVREETKRSEREEEENRRKRRRSRERRRAAEARELYDTRWRALLEPSENSGGSLRFPDIPWPVLPPDLSSRRTKELALDDLTVEAISSFLLVQGNSESEAGKKERKDKLRETMLRFHPDKFEGRILKRVVESERETVMEAVGIVVRSVNTLMGGGK